MSHAIVRLHPIYGSVYKHGEFVEPGDVLGVSVDANGVVTAPARGFVKVVEELGADPTRRQSALCIEIVDAQDLSQHRAADRLRDL